MENQADATAWLELTDGSRIPIQKGCTIGRSRSNTIALANDKVSRRHAIVHVQSEGEFWLIDLGSSNGTYLNGRRVSQPTLLIHLSRIEIGNDTLTFQQPKSAQDGDHDKSTLQTIENIRAIECWLLVADIESSTKLIQAFPPEEGSRVTGRWLASCKKIIDTHGGAINKFLGDGFFAYWTHSESTLQFVAEALKDLRKHQKTGELRFRVILHYGTVFVGGAGSLGEDSLHGKEVNFAFRMEKVAGSAGATCMLSQPANDLLKSLITTSDLGLKPVPSFDGEFPFFSLP